MSLLIYLPFCFPKNKLYPQCPHNNSDNYLGPSLFIQCHLPKSWHKLTKQNHFKPENI